MNYDEYRALPMDNWSQVKHILTSPAHYRAALATPRKDTPAMAMGRLIHSVVLEPHRPHDALIWDGGERTTKAGKEAWAEWCEAHGLDRASRASDVVTLTPDDLTTALRCRDAVWAHADARDVLIGARTEVTLVNATCKGRADILRDDSVWDLKTARNLERRAWDRACVDGRYYEQLDYYARLAGVERTGIIGVETHAPYDVIVMEIGEATRYRARDIVDGALALLAECRATGDWHGRYPARETRDAPGWWFPELEMDDFNFTEDDDNGR